MNKPSLPLKQRVENIRKKLADIKKMLEKAEQNTKLSKNKHELTY